MDPALATRHSPLRLLIGLHLTQLWRKFRDANKRSGSLTWIIVGFVATYPVIASWLFFHGLRKLSRIQGIGPVLIDLEVKFWRDTLRQTLPLLEEVRRYLDERRS